MAVPASLCQPVLGLQDVAGGHQRRRDGVSQSVEREIGVAGFGAQFPELVG